MADIAALAIPRAAGTEGERSAIDFVLERFRALGYTAVVEPFRFDSRALGVAWPVALRLSAAALMASLVVPPAAALALHLFALAAPALGFLMVVAILRRDRGERPSANILAAPDPTTATTDPRAVPRARVVVLAHHDSKSQPVSFAGRTVAALAAVAGSLGAFASLAVSSPGSTVRIICLVPAILGFLVVSHAAAGNRSPGALDNASGVAVLLEVARRMRARNPAPPVRFVVTGAEEHGLVGALRYLSRYDRALDRERDLFLNLDTVGGAGPLILTGHVGRAASRRARALVETFRSEARAMGVELRSRRVPLPAAVDSYVPSARGFGALTLASGTLRTTYRYLHRPSDSVDRVDPCNLDRAATLVERVIDRVTAPSTGGG